MEMLRFKDTTFGSFTSVRRCPTAGFRLEFDGFTPLTEPPPSARALRGPWLIENETASDGRPVAKRYAPLKRGNQLMALPANLARLRTPKQFLVFANQYGYLGHPLNLGSTADDRQMRGEALAFWAHHARQLSILIELMLWLKRGDRKRLASAVKWESEQVVVCANAVLDSPQEESRWPKALASSSGEDLTQHIRSVHFPIFDPVVLRRWRRGDVLGPASFYVAEVLNREVKGHISPKVPVFAQAEAFGLYHEPDCLLSAIYLALQLAFCQYRDSAPKDFQEWKRCSAAGCEARFPAEGNRRYCDRPACARWARNERQARWRIGRATEGATPIATPKPMDDDGLS